MEAFPFWIYLSTGMFIRARGGGKQTSPIFVTWWSTENWRHIRFQKSSSSSLSELQDGRSGVYGFFFLVTTTDTQLLILNTRDVKKLLDYLF